MENPYLEYKTIKLQSICNIMDLIGKLQSEIEVLDALDRNVNDANSYELTDQMHTMNKFIEKARAVTSRAFQIVVPKIVDDSGEPFPAVPAPEFGKKETI